MSENRATLDDKELMRRFQQGDELCFEELVDRHKQRVMNLVYRFTGGRSDAEDIAQDIFVKIYKAREKYQPTAKFTTWLYVICRNTCFKVISKKKLPVVESHDEEKELLDQVADKHVTTPSEAAVYEELELAVRAAVDALPETQRMTIILSRYEQLSYAEIADAMDISVKAVKSLLHRAKVSLKEAMNRYL